MSDQCRNEEPPSIFLPDFEAALRAAIRKHTQEPDAFVRIHDIDCEDILIADLKKAALEFMQTDMRFSWRQGLVEAARRMCSYCERDGAPAENDQKVPVHRTFSSRGLGTDHACLSQPIWDRIEEDDKLLASQQSGTA